MSLRDELAGTMIRDPRYSIQSYLFVLEALEYTRVLMRRTRPRGTGRRRGAGSHAHHVTGRELCEGARQLALESYGLMARMVLGEWGLKSTSDIGEVVYNLIETGDLEKTPTDSRADFDDVYDFARAFGGEVVLKLEEIE